MSFSPVGGNISGADDVALNNPQDNQVLGYNATLSKWENKANNSHSHDITDVTGLQGALDLKADATDVGAKIMVYNEYADAPALPVNTVVVSITGL